MKRIVNLFTVPVLEAILDIDNHQLVQKIDKLIDQTKIKRVLSHEWNKHTTIEGYSTEGYSSYNDPTGDLLKHQEFSDFFNSVSNITDEFFGQFSYNGNWEYVNSWAAIYPKGAFVPRHDHGDVHWAGVYYVQVEDITSETVFDDPKEYSLTNEPQGFNCRGCKSARFEPAVGKLLLWPAYLKHYSMPNLSDTDRIIISFNIICK